MSNRLPTMGSPGGPGGCGSLFLVLLVNTHPAKAKAAVHNAISREESAIGTTAKQITGVEEDGHKMPCSTLHDYMCGRQSTDHPNDDLD